MLRNLESGCHRMRRNYMTPRKDIFEKRHFDNSPRLDSKQTLTPKFQVEKRKLKLKNLTLDGGLLRSIIVAFVCAAAKRAKQMIGNLICRKKCTTDITPDIRRLHPKITVRLTRRQTMLSWEGRRRMAFPFTVSRILFPSVSIMKFSLLGFSRSSVNNREVSSHDMMQFSRATGYARTVQSDHPAVGSAMQMKFAGFSDMKRAFVASRID